MEQYDQALEATNTALNSSGSGYRENAEYLKSYEAQINMVKNAWVESIISMRDSGFGDALVLGLKAGLELINLLTLIIDKIGVLPTLLGGGSLALLAMSERFRNLIVAVNTSGKSIGKWTLDTVRNLKTVEASANKTAMTLSRATSVSPVSYKGNIPNIASEATKATGAVAKLSGVLGTLGGAVLPIAGFMALGAAVSWVTGKIVEQQNHYNDLKKSVEETLNKNTEALTTNRDKTEELLESYKNLSKEREEAFNSGKEWSNEKEEEYLSISKELGDIFPGLVESINSKGEVHLKNADAIQKEIDRSEELIRLGRLDTLKNEESKYKEDIKDLEYYQKMLKSTKQQLEGAQRTAEKGFGAFSRENAEKQIPRLEAEIMHFEVMIEGMNSKLGMGVKDVSQAYMDLNGVIEGISNESIRLYDNLDFTGMSKSEISDVRRELDAFAVSRSEAFEAGDLERFNSLSKTLTEHLVNSFGLTSAQAKELISDFYTMGDSIAQQEEKANKTADAIRNLRDETDNASDSMNEFEDSVENVAEYMYGLKDSAYKFANAIESVAGVSKKHVEDADDLMWKYESLQQQLSYLTEGTEEYSLVSSQLTNTLIDLVGMFPNLTDEAFILLQTYEELSNSTYRNATENDELTLAKQRLLAMFPQLEQAGINQMTVTEAVIATIHDETRANDILLAAYSASHKGILTAEEETYLAKLTATNGRIASINAEIDATSKLTAAYKKLAGDTKEAALAAEAEFGRDSSEAASAWRAHIRYATLGGREEALRADLAREMNVRVKYTDILANSTNVLSNATTRSNKAIDNARKAREKANKATKSGAKAQKENNKETENAIFVTDRYKRSLELLRYEMGRVQRAKNNAIKGSKEHRKAIEQELALYKEELRLNKERAKDLNRQIATGNIQRTGVVTSSASSSVNSVESTVWNFFKSKGLGDNAVAGIMGNIRQESNFNPKNVNKSSGASGIFQWLGSRKKELMNYAKQIGKSWEDINVQLEFAWKELNSTEKRALESLRKGLTVSQHASEFDRLFERSGRSQVGKRQSYANSYYSQYAGISTNPSTKTTQKGNPNASYYMGSTFRRTSGFGRRNTGIAGASTNHMGADFAAPRGTDIKSLRNGKVVASYYHNAQGHVIRIQQDDGVVAQYQHMQNKSALKVGQAVSAGQSIGKVGSTGVSSGPHLHLEISQNGKKVDPIPYLKKQINAVTTSTKEIAQQASDVDGLKSDLIQLGQDELSIIDKISQAYHELVESNIAYYENLISGVDFSLTKADKTLMEHANTSDGYRKNLEQQVKHLEYKQYLLYQEANYIREQLKNEELSASMIADLRKKLSELGLAWLDVRDAVKATNMEIINSKNLQFDDLLTGVDQSLSKIDKQLQYYEEGGFAYLAVLEEQIKHYEYKQTLLKKQENYLREQLKSGKLTKDQAKEIEMQISNIVLAWWDVENAITGVNNSMKEQSDKLADDIIDSMKAVYEHQKQQALQAIDAQIKAEEERHRKQMKIYDDELSAYEKIIQAKLREIDDEYDEDQYEKQLNKMQEERLEIQRKINHLAMDDSYEAKTEKLKLEKELAEQTEKIQEFQDDRERKLRKDNLNDMLEDYREDIENKKEAETEKYDAEIDRLQELRRQQEYHYSEIIKNERKWSAIREDIRNGEIGKHKEFLKEFLDEFENMNEETLQELQDTFYELGLSWQELLNLIDRVNDASKEITSPSTPSSNTPEGSKSIIDKMKDNSTKWSSASASERLQIEKENQILGKEIGATYHPNSGVWEKDGKHLYHSDEVQKVIDQMIANASQWQKADPEEKKRLEELNKALGKSIGATYNNGTGTWYKNGLKLYHEGGVVGDKPLNKATELANKLFNSKPNEQVIKALKGELMIPPQNIPNLFGNIGSLLNSISLPPVISTGSDISIEFNIDKVVGDESTAKKFGDQILQSLTKEINDKYKRERGGI